MAYDTAKGSAKSISPCRLTILSVGAKVILLLAANVYPFVAGAECTRPGLLPSNPLEVRSA